MIRVVTDSSCDLPPRIVEELKIVVVPMIVRIGGEEFLGTDLGIDEFWVKVHAARARGLFPQTSQPSMGVFEEVFASLTEGGGQVVCVTITGRHSGTFSTAWAAARRFGEAVTVVDSRTTSLGLGFLAMAAAQAAHSGASLGEIEALLKEMRTRTHLFVVLDTVEFIRRGGRADALMPMLSRLMRFLEIKPIIGFIEGKLKLLGQARTFPAALTRLDRQVVALCPLKALAVLHTRRPYDAQLMAARLRESTGFQGQILVKEAEATLSSHAGPGVVGVVGVRAS